MSSDVTLLAHMIVSSQLDLIVTLMAFLQRLVELRFKSTNNGSNLITSELNPKKCQKISMINFVMKWSSNFVNSLELPVRNIVVHSNRCRFLAAGRCDNLIYSSFAFRRQNFRLGFIHFTAGSFQNV